MYLRKYHSNDGQRNDAGIGKEHRVGLNSGRYSMLGGCRWVNVAMLATNCAVQRCTDFTCVSVNAWIHMGN